MLMQIFPSSFYDEPKLKLSTIRCIRGYSLTEVAQKINISVGTLRRYERNPEETPLKVAYKLMKLYRCTFSMVQFHNE